MQRQPAPTAQPPVAAPQETDYQRILRETAAARRHAADEKKQLSPPSTYVNNTPNTSSVRGAVDTLEEKSHESIYPKISESKQSGTPHTQPQLGTTSQPHQQQQLTPTRSSHSMPSITSPHTPTRPVIASTKPAQSSSMPNPPSAPQPSPPAASSTSSTVHGRPRQPDGMPLEMPTIYNRDEELARKLQSEEDARARNPSRHSHEDIERRKREQEDERMAREIQRQMSMKDAEAEAADARLAREIQEAEEAEVKRRAEAAKAVAAAAEQERIRQANLAHDAELARSLQLEEASGHSDIPRPVQRRRAPSGTDEDGSDGVMLMPEDVDPDHEQRALDEVHRRHAETNRLRQLQNTADLYSREQQSEQDSSSGARNRRTREQLIQRLHQLQGTYPSGQDHRAASFRFLPDGRLVVSLEDDQDSDSPENRNAIAAAAMDGVEDVPSPTSTEAQQQRELLEAYERQHREQQEAEAAAGAGASNNQAGILGVFGNMLLRYVSNRQRGIPFPLSVMIDPRGSSSSSSFILRDGGLHGATELDVDRMSYEQLLQLEDALGSVKPKVKPAKEEDLEHLPTRTFKKPISTANNPTAAASSTSSSSGSKPSVPAAPNQGESACSICLCDFEEGDSVKTLPCFHSFHSFEIDKWLLTNERCPVCRIAITDKPN